MQKRVEFYRTKGSDTIKLGCTLPNLANICLHSSLSAKFYQFSEGDKILLSKVREDTVRGPSILFTREAVFNETHIRKSIIVCKSVFGEDASELYPYSMCQPMATGPYTGFQFEASL